MIPISIKQLIITIILVTVILSTAIFSLVSNNYLDDYFNDYIEQTYQDNKNNIIEYAKVVINEGHQPKMILNSYVIDPIYYAEIYDNNGMLVMNSGMKGMHSIADEENKIIEQYDVLDNNQAIGKVKIVRATQVKYTETKQVFLRSIYTGGIIAIVVVLIIMGVITVGIVKYIAESSNQIVNYATNDEISSGENKIREFNAIGRAIKHYKEELATKERIKKEKFDRLLHETKTPITVLKSQLEAVVDDIIVMDGQRAQTMVDEVDKLSNMLGDVTTIIEGNDTHEQPLLEQIDYSKELEKIVSSLKTKFKNKQLSLVYNQQAFEIKTDAQLLNNVIYNLLMNSYKYTQTGVVSIETNNEQKSITIRDTGIGISESDINNIFNPYYRGENVNTIEGEGLGLYNVKQTVESIKASISVESQMNQFTQFTIKFTS